MSVLSILLALHGCLTVSIVSLFVWLSTNYDSAA
jgi:hypothetical protein